LRVLVREVEAIIGRSIPLSELPPSKLGGIFVKEQT
jgi:hypothetical protein